MNKTEYYDYKNNHIKNKTFTYYQEYEIDGSITFSTIYIPWSIKIIFIASKSDAAFKDDEGKYVKEIIATTSYNWSVGIAFDDGEIPTPVLPG